MLSVTDICLGRAVIPLHISTFRQIARCQPAYFGTIQSLCRAFVNPMRLRCRSHGHDLCFMNGWAEHVQQIETNDPIEARRSRYAQYRGQIATLTFGPETVKGLVRSVREDSSTVPVRWLVTIVAQ